MVFAAQRVSYSCFLRCSVRRVPSPSLVSGVVSGRELAAASKADEVTDYDTVSPRVILQL